MPSVLALMACVLRRTGDGTGLENGRNKMNRLINGKVWHEETGMHWHRMWKENASQENI